MKRCFWRSRVYMSWKWGDITLRFLPYFETLLNQYFLVFVMSKFKQNSLAKPSKWKWLSFRITFSDRQTTQADAATILFKL